MPALLTLADWLTGAYEGTQKADEELLRSGGVQGRLRSAVLVRVAERRLARRFKEEVLRLLAEEEDRGTLHPTPPQCSILTPLYPDTGIWIPGAKHVCINTGDHCHWSVKCSLALKRT